MSEDKVTNGLFDYALHAFERTWVGKVGLPVDIKSASVNLFAITVLTTYLDRNSLRPAVHWALDALDQSLKKSHVCMLACHGMR